MYSKLMWMSTCTFTGRAGKPHTALAVITSADDDLEVLAYGNGEINGQPVSSCLIDVGAGLAR